MVAQLFMIAVTIVILGWLWFFIVRPILEDYGVLGRAESVNNYPAPTPVVMSNERAADPPSIPSALRTDDGRTETAAPGPKFTEEQLLTLYAGLRAHGMVRDKASQLLKASGIPMNNNLWAKAAPPPPPPAEDDDLTVTPIAGRVTRASFYQDDPDLQFQPPPR